jgi:signal transduction histidine kinase
MRWLLIAASLVLVLVWPPPDLLPMAVMSLLVAYNLSGWWVLPRLTTMARARASGIVSMALLNVFVGALAFSYSYLPESSAWTGFYFLPLSAALRFGMGASLPQAAVVTLLDAGGHYYAQERYGIAFDGPGLVVRACVYAGLATFAGAWARTVARQRRALSQAAADQTRLAAAAAVRAQRFRALTGIQREITERLELGAVCTHVAQSAAQLLAADHARVWVSDRRTGALAAAAEWGHAGAPGHATAETGHHADSPGHATGETGHRVGRVGLDDATAEAAVRSEQPLVSRDEGAGIFSICLPMRFEGEVVGVLGVVGPADSQPDPEQVELLHALTASGAIAIENARLFEVRGQAEALQRLDEIKSEFVRTISHELRTPLTLILGYAELLTVDPAAPPPVHSAAGHILRNSELMTRLVDDLLTFAQLERGEVSLQRAPLDVGDLLGDVLADSARLPGGERLRLERGGPATVDADPARLAQVVSNLIANALRYAPHGPISVLCTSRPGRVRVEVADQGPGIPVDERARVWERFYRGRGVAGVGGTRSMGLGLAIVKTLIQAHGGSVGLVCPPAGGATFWVELPAAPAPDPASRPRQRPV